MRIISLNLWIGRAYDNLVQFLQKEKVHTDIFCFQEVLDSRSGVPSAEIKETKASMQQLASMGVSDLYTKLEGMLEGFDGFLSEAYGFGAERLATFAKKGLHAKVRVLTVHKPIAVNMNGKPFWMRSIAQHINAENDENAYDIAQVHGLWQSGGKEDTPERKEQSHMINKILSDFGERRILCGDFNLLPDTESIRILEEGAMRNLIKEYRINTTRSSLASEGKGKFADYMFVSDKIRVEDFKVPKIDVSDHLPLCLDFE
jgi:exonuclease III